MKIGFDAKRAFLNHSGLGNYSRSLLSALSEFNSNNHYVLYTPKQTDLHLFQSSNTEVKTPISFLSKTFKSTWRTYGILPQLIKDNVQVYHGLSHELPKGIEKTTIASVVTIHDLIFLRYPDIYPFIDRKIYLNKIKYSCAVADKIIAISQQTKEDLIHFLHIPSDKIEVVYQNCDANFKRTCLEKEKKEVAKKYNLPANFILSVGSVEERKNLISVIKAFNQLQNETVHLVVLGKHNTKYISKVKAEIINKSKSKIHFLEKVNFKDFPAIYQLSKMLIYPSLFEGFGIPIVEALYSKTPVITSKGGCFKEVGGADSLYVSPLQINEIVKAITTLLTKSNLHTEIIEKGYNFVQKFNDQTMAKQLENIYSSIVK